MDRIALVTLIQGLLIAALSIMTMITYNVLHRMEKRIEKNLSENSNIEHKYEIAKIELQEISLRSKENVDSEISFKQKELDRLKISLKQLSRSGEDLNEDLEIP